MNDTEHNVTIFESPLS